MIHIIWQRCVLKKLKGTTWKVFLMHWFFYQYKINPNIKSSVQTYEEYIFRRNNIILHLWRSLAKFNLLYAVQLEILPSQRWRIIRSRCLKQNSIVESMMRLNLLSRETPTHELSNDSLYRFKGLRHPDLNYFISQTKIKWQGLCRYIEYGCIKVTFVFLGEHKVEHYFHF